MYPDRAKSSHHSRATSPFVHTLPSRDKSGIDRSGPTISIPEETILKTAQKRAGNISLLILRQAFAEIIATFQKKNFRKRENDVACQAYCAMDMEQFEGINARQSWANWRTLPRNLNQRLPSSPLSIIDLCCGIGQSTEVLAHYATPGSKILGLEFNPRFVELALERRYPDENGDPARVSFNAQSVLETFCDEAQQPLPAGSIDLVNSCGAVGAHFDPAATTILAREVARVLRPGGLATIDSAKEGTSTENVEAIFSAMGFEKLHQAKSCAADRFTQICFRKS